MTSHPTPPKGEARCSCRTVPGTFMLTGDPNCPVHNPTDAGGGAIGSEDERPSPTVATGGAVQSSTDGPAESIPSEAGQGEGVKRIRLWRAPKTGWTDWRAIADQNEEWSVSISPGAEDLYVVPESSLTAAIARAEEAENESQVRGDSVVTLQEKLEAAEAALAERDAEREALASAAKDGTVALDKVPGGWKITIGYGVRLAYGDGDTIAEALDRALHPNNREGK